MKPQKPCIGFKGKNLKLNIDFVPSEESTTGHAASKLSTTRLKPLLISAMLSKIDRITSVW